MVILWYSVLSFTVCPAFYVGLERARHSVKICGEWVATIEVYENPCALWPIMESMAALDSMALKTGFADVGYIIDVVRHSSMLIILEQVDTAEAVRMT